MFSIMVPKDLWIMAFISLFYHIVSAADLFVFLCCVLPKKQSSINPTIKRKCISYCLPIQKDCWDEMFPGREISQENF